MPFTRSRFANTPYALRDRGTARRRTDPTADVRVFREGFESKYGTTHPTFHAGSYSQVLDEAKKELKFLLVYLHCADHQGVYCSKRYFFPCTKY